MYNKYMNAIIYAHRNKINNKYYIGQTIQEPTKRWKCGYGYVHSEKFYNAIKKYGWSNFEHIILCKCNIEDADRLEKYYIKKFNSIENGYNVATGGRVNHIVSDETRIKLRNARLKLNLKGKPLCKHKLPKSGYKYISEYPNTKTFRVRIHHLHISKNFKSLKDAIEFRDKILKEYGE